MILACLTPPKGLCSELEEALGLKAQQIEKKKFPDGENYVRIPFKVSDENVVLVHTGFEDQNDRLMELFLTLDVLNDLGAKSITLVMPYMPYARQDRRFREGEAVSIKAIFHILNSFEVDNLVVVNIHKEHSLAHFSGTSINLNALPELAKRVTKESDEIVVVAPDKGASQYAQEVANEIDAPWTFLEKFRDRVTGEVSMTVNEIDVVKGKMALLVDDIVSTGGTLALATKILRENGAKKVIPIIVHALLVGNAPQKLKEAGVEELITANTLYRDYPDFVRVESISNLIVDALDKLLTGRR
ncbi:ribose-phosphate pyrophosphokinase [Ignicoccus islandicus DSM 13165]|uniref:Ribose-phosphate pyrophosphokinase n=1 Tax=Ignicoccus islandicus DSM 13165 TaxID=940295 RepID=A0A0U3FPZ1_9CREN|nr:ribose-phosphate diphosphokinase [Ignicoccus islandicus]ALU12007.1 ribose-phosphate pyrophosphokinase [Ignicoccus islandicus DSM 13165]